MPQRIQIPRSASGLALYKEGADWGVIPDRKATRLRGEWSTSPSPAYAAGDVVIDYLPDGRRFSAVALSTPGSNAPTSATVGVSGSGTRVWAYHSGVIYPVTDLSGMPTYETIVEQGFRGQGSRDLNLLQGGASGDMSFSAWMYPDILGNILRPIFGQVTSTPAALTVGGLDSAVAFDATAAIARGDIVSVAQTGPARARYYRALKDIAENTSPTPAVSDTTLFEHITRPTIHTFQRADIPASATIFQALGAGPNEALRFSGARCGEVGLTFNSNSGVLEGSTTWMSQEPVVDTFPSLFSSPGATGADDPGPAYVGWQGRVTTSIPDEDASITGRLIGAEITIARELEVVHTARNNRSPYSINIDPIGIAGRLTVVAQNFDAQYAEWRRFPERSLVIEFSSNKVAKPGETPDAEDPYPERTIKIQLSRANMANGPFEIDRSAVGVVFQLPFMALHNLVDEGPGQIIVQSAAPVF